MTEFTGKKFLLPIFLTDGKWDYPVANLLLATINFKAWNGYPFRGSNSTFLFYFLPCKCWINSYRKEFAPVEKILSFNCRSHFRRGLSFRKANSNFVTNVGKTWSCIHSPYHISSAVRPSFFPFQNNPKNLDPSHKMDLDLGNCLGRIKLIL